MNYLKKTIAILFIATVICYWFLSQPKPEKHEFSSSKEAVKSLVEDYFRGRKNGDIKLLLNSFHPTSDLYNLDATSKNAYISLNTYIDIVKKQGAIQCNTTLISMKVKEDKAIVHTRFAYEKVNYLDSLLIARIDKKWWIMHKFFKKE